MIENLESVFLDLGRVLFHLNYRETFEKIFSKSRLDQDKLKRVLTYNGLNIEFETGKITEEAFFLKMIHQAEFTGSDKEFIQPWIQILSPIKKNLEFAQELAQKYKIGIISNTNEAHLRFMEKTGGLAAFSEHRIYSCRVGYMKPRKEIYIAALSQSNAIPQRSIFLDDREENVETAQSLGFHAYLFPKGEDLRKFWNEKILHV